MTQRQIKRELFRKKRLQQQKIKVQKDKEYNHVKSLVAQAKSGAVVNTTEAATALNALYWASENLTNNYKQKDCVYVLQMGCLLNELKKQHKGNWVLALKNYIPDKKVRTKQAWMQLAKVDGVWNYTHLGYSALSKIYTKIKPLYTKKHQRKPFHLFFAESTYPSNVYNNITEVKKLIDVHVFEVKAKRDGLICDIGKLRDLAVYPGVLNDALREDLLNSYEDGGDEAVSKRLDRYILGRGKLPRQRTDYQSKSKKLTIDRIKVTVAEVSDHYSHNFNSLGEINIKDVELLYIKIESLFREKFAYDLIESI